MSERSVKVFNKGTVLPDAVTLFVNNRVFEGWKVASVSKQINALASVFRLDIVERVSLESEPWNILPGASCHLHIGKHSILTGYVDVLSIDADKSTKNISISGRSRTADLVDCSADVTTAQLKELNIKQIAELLLKPFGLSLVFNGEPGEPFPNFTVRQGETVFEILDRLAKTKKFLVRDSAGGNVIIEQRGNVLAGTELKEGINLKSVSATFDNSERFSQYKIKSQSGSEQTVPGLAAQSSEVLGTASDAGIGRYRPLIIISENSEKETSANARAQYEANLRAAQASKVSVSVQGWYRANGLPWDVNQLVNLVAPSAGIKRTMLIERVQFDKGGSGTTTKMDLVRKDAYDFGTTKQKVEKDESIEGILGLKQ